VLLHGEFVFLDAVMRAYASTHEADG